MAQKSTVSLHLVLPFTRLCCRATKRSCGDTGAGTRTGKHVLGLFDMSLLCSGSSALLMSINVKKNNSTLKLSDNSCRSPGCKLAQNIYIPAQRTDNYAKWSEHRQHNKLRIVKHPIVWCWVFRVFCPPRFSLRLEPKWLWEDTSKTWEHRQSLGIEPSSCRYVLSVGL